MIETIKDRDERRGIASHAAADAERPDARRRVGSVVVSGGLVVSVLALLPGIASRFELLVDPSTRLGLGLQVLREALMDIRFGSGVRFWLGVLGAAMMATLLLYPLRKMLAARGGMGRVSSWFRLHLIFGFVAPIAILYHANFGLGGFNANIALWTMLAIVVSGLVGHYIHGAASARYVKDVRRADTLLADISRLVEATAAGYRERQTFIADLQELDAQRIKPVRGIITPLRSVVAIKRERRAYFDRAMGLVLAGGSSLAAREGVELPHAINAYFALSLRAAKRAVGEQLWARWRLFHLPLFLVMTVATGLHVAAVWDFDPAPVAPPAGRSIETPAPPKTSLDTLAIKQIRRPSIDVIAKDVAARPVNPTQEPERSGSDSAAAIDQIAQSPTAAALPPVLQAPVPKLVRKPAPAVAAIAPVAKPAVKAPQVAVAPPVVPPSPTQATATEPDIKTVYSEVQRRFEQKPMALGGGFPRTLVEQIALLTARQKAGQFAHSLSETGFALTGKHTRVECASCHKAPLKETRQEAPRQCVACHKKDDVHRGRRPDCASCHTTNRWSEIVRRR